MYYINVHYSNSSLRLPYEFKKLEVALRVRKLLNALFSPQYRHIIVDQEGNTCSS